MIQAIVPELSHNPQHLPALQRSRGGQGPSSLILREWARRAGVAGQGRAPQVRGGPTRAHALLDHTALTGPRSPRWPPVREVRVTPEGVPLYRAPSATGAPPSARPRESEPRAPA